VPAAIAANVPTFSVSPAGSISAVAIDSAGNTYIAGFPNVSTFKEIGPGGRPLFDATPGAFQTISNIDGYCATVPMVGVELYCAGSFIEKLDSSGNVLFATLFSGNGDTWISALAVDREGNVYVAGTTTAPSLEQNAFPVTSFQAAIEAC
jgi:hypothetical protein